MGITRYVSYCKPMLDFLPWKTVVYNEIRAVNELEASTALGENISEQILVMAPFKSVSI